MRSPAKNTHQCKDASRCRFCRPRDENGDFIPNDAFYEEIKTRHPLLAGTLPEYVQYMIRQEERRRKRNDP